MIKFRYAVLGIVVPKPKLTKCCRLSNLLYKYNNMNVHTTSESLINKKNTSIWRFVVSDYDYDTDDFIRLSSVEKEVLGGASVSDSKIESFLEHGQLAELPHGELVLISNPSSRSINGDKVVVTGGLYLDDGNLVSLWLYRNLMPYSAIKRVCTRDEVAMFLWMIDMCDCEVINSTILTSIAPKKDNYSLN